MSPAAVLTELSARARPAGLLSSETCVAVFALKEAVFGIAAGTTRRPRRLHRASPAGRRPGPVDVRDVRAAREQIIADQAEQLLELSTPVVKLWDGILAVPLVGTLDSRAHAGRHGEAAADPGRHRQRARDHRHHRRAGRRHPGRPAPAQDRRRGPADGRRVHHQRHPPADRADDRRSRDRVRRHPDQGHPRRRSAAALACDTHDGVVATEPADGATSRSSKSATSLLVSIQVDLEDHTALRCRTICPSGSSPPAPTAC